MKKILFILFMISFSLFCGINRAPRMAAPSEFDSDAVVGKNGCDLAQLSSFFGSLKKLIINSENITCDKFQQTWTILQEIEASIGCERLIYQTDIPLVITEPGIYCLAEPILFDNGIAIDIQTSNVVIDLKGQRINGMNSGEICIRAQNVMGIIIQNGGLQNAQGIVMHNCAGVLINDIPCRANRDWGIRLSNCTRFKVVNCKALVTQTTLPLTPFSGTGFVFDTSKSAVIRDLLASGCTGNALLAVDDECMSFEGILVNECGQSGIVIDDSNDIHILNCIASANTDYGFLFTNSLGQTNTTLENFFVLDSLANKNGKSGFGVVSTIPDGLMANMLFDTCKAGANLEHGFEISGTNIIVRNAAAVDNQKSGYFINGFDTQVINNSALANVENGIVLTTAAFVSQVIRNTVSKSSVGINDLSSGTNLHQIYNNVAGNNSTNYSGVSFVLNPQIPDPLFGNSQDLVANICGF